MSDFTPGPWFVHDKKNHFSVGRNEVYEYERIVADLPQWSNRTAAQHGNPANVEANAYLIAAAPELFHVLQYAHELLVRLVSPIESDSTMQCYAEARRVELLARAALAKAKGQPDA